MGVDRMRRSISLHSRVGRERSQKAATLSHYPAHRRVTFAVPPALVRESKTIERRKAKKTSYSGKTSIDTDQSYSNFICSNKIKSSRSDSEDVKSEKEGGGSLTWVDTEDSGRGSCSDESQVLTSIDTIAPEGEGKLSPTQGDESAYSYAYSSLPTEISRTQSQTNTLSTSPEEGNIYEEIRPLEKASDPPPKTPNDGESAGKPLVLNIKSRRPHHQKSHRFTDWDLTANLRDPEEAFQPIRQVNSLQHERSTQTEGALDSSGGDLGDLVKRDSSDLEHRGRKGEAKCGLVHEENLVGEQRMVVGRAKRRSNSDLGRKLSLSKSFSRLLSFRKSKK